jgi:hypothetical protein
MIVIVEMNSYIKKTEKIMTPKVREDIVDFLTRRPKAGALMPDTGGLRKYIHAKEGQGKSGGYRVICYYYDDKNPLFLVAAFEKNEKDNLSKEEKNELKKFVQVLKKGMKK